MGRSKRIGVGLIGFGTIGTGVVKVLKQNAGAIRDRLGAPLEIVKIADLDVRTDRGVKVRKGVLTRDARGLIQNPAVDVVVELIGGVEPAKTFHTEALAAGKPVVTANKALLSEFGAELAGAAEKQGVAYGFEASVGGGIPIVRTLRSALAGDRNTEICGLMNGTANYILSEMAAGAGEFSEVLARAQALGLAEADPTYDVEGIDSAHKLVVLVALAFGKRIRLDKVYCEGIRQISGADMAYAEEFGYTIKLLASARLGKDGVEARVHPSMVPNSHLLSQVSGAFNAVCVRGDALGSSIYYGQGAGSLPTATAVVSDVIDAARAILSGTAPSPAPYGRPVASLERAKVIPMGGTSHEYYLRFHVADRPGVLATIASYLAEEGISIATVAQHEKPVRGVVPIVIRTHRAVDAALQRALKRFARRKECRGKPVVIRVEEALGAEA